VTECKWSIHNLGWDFCITLGTHLITYSTFAAELLSLRLYLLDCESWVFKFLGRLWRLLFHVSLFHPTFTHSILLFHSDIQMFLEFYRVKLGRQGPFSCIPVDTYPESALASLFAFSCKPFSFVRATLVAINDFPYGIARLCNTNSKKKFHCLFACQVKINRHLECNNIKFPVKAILKKILNTLEMYC